MTGLIAVCVMAQARTNLAASGPADFGGAFVVFVLGFVLVTAVALLFGARSTAPSGARHAVCARH